MPLLHLLVGTWCLQVKSWEEAFLEYPANTLRFLNLMWMVFCIWSYTTTELKGVEGEEITHLKTGINISKVGNEAKKAFGT